jgi:hypothetical protein
MTGPVDDILLTRPEPCVSGNSDAEVAVKDLLCRAYVMDAEARYILSS